MAPETGTGRNKPVVRSAVGGHQKLRPVQTGVPLLQCVGVYKSFEKFGQQVPAVRGIDLTINEAEMVAITGASGVGKSTLLHILGTLEPPTRGQVLYGRDGEDVFQYNERELSLFRNRTLGFIFQFHYLLPEFNAIENVMMPALIAGHNPGLAEKQARELLDFVGLSHRLRHRPTELSGGEQQRVAIARSVILRPKVILADELTGNLDSQNGNMILDLLAQLNQATGVSVLLVTHDQAIAQRMHRILVMKDGRIVDEIRRN